MKFELQLQRWYRIFRATMVMVLSVAVATFLTMTMTLQAKTEESSPTSFPEAIGVVAFACYWYLTSQEVIQTSADGRVLRAQPVTPPPTARQAFSEAAGQDVRGPK
ncbi:hypothetical protein [Thauera aminoaromatica]|uniref:Uncharacterized protein n=1 Tax=Thauera aminoaromatica TaxID=164330 RepID=A0A5C7S2V5_THASP|nr:hypothetical protein [Thauera aminoaromatica]TXH77592.1 MAG: hypothetical protein E6Q80_24465 [Thauera aminoaromatica]